MRDRTVVAALLAAALGALTAAGQSSEMTFLLPARDQAMARTWAGWPAQTGTARSWLPPWERESALGGLI